MVWLCIAGFWDVQTTSFEIPWFLRCHVMWVFFLGPPGRKQLPKMAMNRRCVSQNEGAFKNPNRNVQSHWKLMEYLQPKSKKQKIQNLSTLGSNHPSDSVRCWWWLAAGGTHGTGHGNSIRHVRCRYLDQWPVWISWGPVWSWKKMLELCVDFLWCTTLEYLKHVDMLWIGTNLRHRIPVTTQDNCIPF